MGHYNSFIVRIWTGEHGRLRGSIEHVTTRDSLVFANPDAVVPFIRGHLEFTTVDAMPEPKDSDTEEGAPDE